MELWAHCAQASLDISEALPILQLCERQAAKLIQGGKRFDRVQDDVDQVVSIRLHVDKPNVQQVREPGDGMPVAAKREVMAQPRLSAEKPCCTLGLVTRY